MSAACRFKLSLDGSQIGLAQFAHAPGAERRAAESDDLPKRNGFRLRRRSLIVLFTEFVDTVTAELMIENVAHLNRRHLILFVSLGDPDLQQRIDATPQGMRDIAGAVVAHSLAHERDTVYERLRRLGVQCVEARDDLTPSELVNRYLDVKRREMI